MWKWKINSKKWGQRMRVLTLLLTALILGACANQPTVDPPDWSSVANLEKKPVTDPRALPALCEVPWPATAVLQIAT